MPQMAQLVLKNHADEDVTFTPNRIDQNDVAIFRNISGSKPVGYASLTSRVREPSFNGTTYRVTLNIALPELATLTPPGSTDETVDVIRTNRVNVEFILPNQSTTTTRQNLLAYLKSALADSKINDTIINLESFY